MIENPRIGQKVWFREMWSGCIHSAKITGFGETEVPASGSEKCQYVTTEPYAELEWDDGGNSSCLLRDLYASRKELVDALKKESEDRISKIKSEIHNVNDLVKFMYDNCVASAEEYTDWDARRAVKEISKEMLGLELE